MPSKRFQALVKEKPAESLSIPEAAAFVKSHATARFDETVELHVRLGVEPARSDQVVRGTVQFPHGTPSSVRVAVFTSDAKLQKAAKESGAEIVGGEELVERVQATGSLDADIAIATPDLMSALAKVARVLGPKGLMPNPKTGTIGPDPAQIVRELKGGKVAFKMDESGIIHLAVGKASWEAAKLVGNVRAALDALRAARPAAAKREFLRSVTLTSTMSPGVPVRV